MTVAGKDIALFNVDGTIYAMEDACVHQGLSLGTSDLRGKVVTCRGHGWRYDVTTGCTLHVEDARLEHAQERRRPDLHSGLGILT